MPQSGSPVSTSLLYRLLQRCAKNKDLDGGRQVHALIVRSGFQSNSFLGNHLIRFYARCGRLVEATRIFTQLPGSARDSFVWAAIVSAHGDHGRPQQAIQFYLQMHRLNGRPDDYVFVAALKACADATALSTGRLIHAHVREHGSESHTFVGNTLIDMYGKCGRLQDARTVFERLPTRDAVTWNAMIAGYVQHEYGLEAFHLFRRMQEECVRPDKMTFASILKACASMAAKEQGQLVHAEIMERGLELDVFVGSSLVDMYAKCGDLEAARQVFDGLSTRDLVTWTALIAGYAHHGDGQDAIALFHRMQSEGIDPNQLTLTSIVKACSTSTALDHGKLLHAHITQSGLDSNVYIGSTLIDMYSKCGHVEDARKVFDTMPHRNLVTWTAMISGYSHSGHGEEAFQLFRQMKLEGIVPNQLTLASILKACSSVGSLDRLKLLHAQIRKSGFESDLFISSALIDVYARCGSLDDARAVFDSIPSKNLVLWSAMIAGYAHHDGGLEALELFSQMQKEGIETDKIMLVSVLRACSGVAALDLGKLIHARIRDVGFGSDVYVGSTLVDFYVKCGSLDEARAVFDRLLARDLVTWTSMIVGYANEGNGQEALRLYQEMQKKGLQPNEVTLVSLVKACSTIAALHQGRLVHARIIQDGFEPDGFVGSSLIDMYAKCGSLQDAQELFDQMLVRDLVSWNAVITGCAQHGFAQAALELFQQMQKEGVQPDHVTFIGLLSACSHCGLLEEGCTLFQSMSQGFGITPEMEHYVCMVDLLGRSGRLAEAIDFIHVIPVQPDIVVWMSLLGASRTHGDGALGQQSFEAILEMDPGNAAAHVLMGDVYAAAGRWEDRAAIRKRMQGLRAKKEPGRTWIELDSKVHIFGVEDRSHSDRRQVYDKLKILTESIRHNFTDLAHERDEMPEDVEARLLESGVEKLALALGFLESPGEDNVCLQLASS